MFWMGNLEKQDKERAGRLSSKPLCVQKKEELSIKAFKQGQRLLLFTD